LFAFSTSLLAVWILFGAYGIYYGLSAGVFRAYIADIVNPDQRALQPMVCLILELA